MSKKKLNLKILELEQLDNNQASVSLMPCPCGASGGGICEVGKVVGGWILGNVLNNIIKGDVQPPDPCTGSMSPCGGPCGSDADFGGISADIGGNPDAW